MGLKTGLLAVLTYQPRTCSVVTLFSLSSDADHLVSERSLGGRKIVASLVFTWDDERLIAVSINCITTMLVPSLDVLHQLHLDNQRLVSSTLFTGTSGLRWG